MTVSGSDELQRRHAPADGGGGPLRGGQGILLLVRGRRGRLDGLPVRPAAGHVDTVGGDGWGHGGRSGRCHLERCVREGLESYLVCTGTCDVG